MSRFGSLVLLGACALALAASKSEAGEFHIAKPVIKNSLLIAPNYLTGIDMPDMPGMPGMPMKSDAVHLELDVHAARNEPHHLREGTWIPYLTIRYTLTKQGSSFRSTGVLQPMIATEGLHYASSVKMAGKGTYHLTYSISAPAITRHTDKRIGVPAWWKPFMLDWNFNYPGIAK